MNLPQTNYSLRNLTIEEEFRLTGSLVPDSILLLLGDIDSLGEEIDVLNAHIAKYRSRRFNITAVLIDGESRAVPIIPDIEALGLAVNPVGAGDHVAQRSAL